MVETAPTPHPQVRRPELRRPRRMDPIATLPVFFKLAGRRVVIAGGGEAAAWKAELVAAAGAHVEVFSEAPGEEIEALAADPPAGRITLFRRAWDIGALRGAALAIGAIEDEAEGRAFACSAREMGVTFNVVDRPQLCAFQFGSIVNRSPLVVGISTDGAAPVFGQAIRASIEALLPQGLARWAQAAMHWRPEVQRYKLPLSGRRKVWELFTARAMAEPERAPGRADLEEMLAAARDAGAAPAAAEGRVYLVGAGPGDPELLTLKAMRALRSADAVLYDDLVADGILDLARREAKRIAVGKTGRRPSCRQDDINALMVELAREGKRVVRLKAGDPMIFGRAGEEMEVLAAAGVPYEIVPGITSLQAAGADLGISLTHRDHAQRLQVVTGHARSGALPETINAAAIADPHATTAVYMPLGTLDALVDMLLAAGAEPSRPVAAVFNASRPERRIVGATLATIAAALAGDVRDGPCILLVGEVVRAAGGPATATSAKALADRPA